MEGAQRELAGHLDKKRAAHGRRLEALRGEVEAVVADAARKVERAGQGACKIPGLANLLQALM